MFPWHRIAHVGVSPSRSLKLICREIIFEVFQPKCDHGTWTSQTDGQTTDCGITVSKFVKVMPKIPWPLFFRTRCIYRAHRTVIFAIARLSGFRCFAIILHFTVVSRCRCQSMSQWKVDNINMSCIAIYYYYYYYYYYYVIISTSCLDGCIAISGCRWIVTIIWERCLSAHRGQFSHVTGGIYGFMM